ncbi:MAG: hypothetical protein JJU45_18890 [Acidimicrobiia bacterium]|nr:hypothetical protein [Acidimicrobiia bacterium]
MAVLDVPIFIADLKAHVGDHHFHVDDERHFVETYSLRQLWEIDVHPDEGCGGPVELHLSLEVEPRALLQFEDQMLALSEDDEPPSGFSFPLTFAWNLPPVQKGPDLLVFATDMARIGGTVLPLEVSAIDSFASVIDAPERSLTLTARLQIGLDRIFLGQEDDLCDVLDRSHEVSTYLLERVGAWMEDG